MSKSDLYDRDFVCWTAENAALIRARRFDEADLEHIAAELEDMGKRDRATVRSKTLTLLTHLLEWQSQPDRRGSSWETTITRERLEIPVEFEHSPSLRRYVADNLEAIYTDATILASKETGLHAASFPRNCPYLLDEIFDRDFLPE